jgi:hypothetical protein
VHPQLQHVAATGTPLPADVLLRIEEKRLEAQRRKEAAAAAAAATAAAPAYMSPSQPLPASPSFTHTVRAHA